MESINRRRGNGSLVPEPAPEAEPELEVPAESPTAAAARPAT
jgi:hypothetical protein